MVRKSVRHSAPILSMVKNTSKKSRRGFTLIELLAVMTIFVVITTIVLTNYNGFGSRVVLENLAYDVALSLRKAQVYGIAVRQFSGGSFSVGYGMHFAQSSPTQYLLFGDSAGNDGMYTQSSELVETELLNSGYVISDLCATPNVGPEVCSLTALDVLYKRPESDAYISASGSSCTPANQANCQLRARVVLQSPKGALVSVIADRSGQIYVQ